MYNHQWVRCPASQDLFCLESQKPQTYCKHPLHYVVIWQDGANKFALTHHAILHSTLAVTSEVKPQFSSYSFNINKVHNHQIFLCSVMCLWYLWWFFQVFLTVLISYFLKPLRVESCWFVCVTCAASCWITVWAMMELLLRLLTEADDHSFCASMALQSWADCRHLFPFS